MDASSSRAGEEPPHYDCRVKYTIAAILLVDGAILAWAWRSMREDFAMVVFALACVTFFGSLPVVLGVWTRRRAEKSSSRNPVPRQKH